MSPPRRSKFETEVGAAVTRELAERRLSQSDLAGRLGKSVAYTNQVMTGRKRASPEWVNLVSEVLGLPPERRGALHVAAAKDAGFELDLTLPKRTPE